MDNSHANNDSILDRVLHSQQTDTLEHFEPMEIITELFKQLNPKEADVLRRRFGLGQNETETLEAIGQSYKVTRERVRQIQRWAIERLRATERTKSLLHGLDALIQQLLDERGGLMLEEELIQHLHSHASKTLAGRAGTQFVLQELMSDKLERVESEQWKSFWKLKFANIAHLSELVKLAESIISQHGKPMNWDNLWKSIQPQLPSNLQQLSDLAIQGAVHVSRTIERNPFNEYGLRTWGSVVPKRMNDKILLVMRKHGQPMHFQEITKKINEIGFDHRQAYPPTVHNELILNPEYVLIGRGIYALREWGYKPGVVADVLGQILRQASQPLTRNELVEQVLAQRMVKKNTIHLALTNKKRFQRLPDGRFILAQAPAENTKQSAT